MPEFTALRADLVVVSPQLQKYNQTLIEDKKLTFELLSDPGNQVAQRYGLVFTLPDDLKELYQKFGIDLSTFNGDDSWTLPMPARYIIDGEGIIRYAQVNPDYTRRPEPQHTIEALKSL